MRRITFVAATAAFVGLAGSVSAKSYQMSPASVMLGETSELRAVAANDTFTVFTGIGTAAGLSLVESSTAPARDDVVIFDGAEEQINDYLASVPPPLSGQRRFVTESSVDNGNGTRTDTIVVRALAAGGDTPADLWPAGLTVGGTPQTDGGWGLGIGLPAALGGSNPVNLEPGSVVLSASIDIVSDGVASGPLAVPLSFFGPSPANWNGQIAIRFSGGANDTAVDSQITFAITTPEPGSIGLLGAAAPLLLRRRRI
jgi:hypothetical protein